MTYDELLKREGAVWGEAFSRLADETPPDWRFMQHRLEYIVTHRAGIDALLKQIRPGSDALELGCGSGWLTLALAQAGARAHGIDISEQALEVAQRYYERVRASVPGEVRYTSGDLNRLSLPAAACDVIVIKGTLHHLLEVPHLMAQVWQALRPGGLLWIHDTLGDEHPRTVLAAAALMFLLPTHTSYMDKLRGLLRFRRGAAERIRLSMQAEGLSPFEGSGREHDWLAITRQYFPDAHVRRGLAITGYLAHQIRLPRGAAVAVLRVVARVDRLLVRAGLLHATSMTVVARRPPFLP